MLIPRGKTFEEHPQGKAAQSIRRGGEISDCLSDNEIDEIFKLLGIPAFHSLLTFTKGQELKQLKLGEIKFAALHWLNHWIGAAFHRRLRKGKDVITVIIFDSIPLKETEGLLIEWLLKVEKHTNIPLYFRKRIAPKQITGSNECGIHVIRNCLRFQKNAEMNNNLSLKHLRVPLQELYDTRNDINKEKQIRLKNAIIRDMMSIEPINIKREEPRGIIKAREFMTEESNVAEIETESEDEEDTNVSLWLAEFPKTGKALQLETTRFQKVKDHLMRKETNKKIKQWHGLSASSESRHREMLRKCTRWVSAEKGEPKQIAVDTFLIAKFLMEKKLKNWTSGTLHSYLASLAVALRMLPLYRQGSPSIYVGERFKAAIRRAKTETKKEGARRIIKEMTEDQKSEIYESMGTDEGKAFMTIAWDLAGRVGDILKLRVENIHETREENSARFAFKFREGKTATNSEYTLHSKITSEPVLRYLRKKLSEERGRLFSMTPKDLRPYLKKYNLECRSIRKGRLIALADSGMPVADILLISRHTDSGTLFHYIGRHVVDEQNLVERTLKGQIMGGRVQGIPTSSPRWIRFEDCPSHEDLQKAFPDETADWQRNVWPVKIKVVDPVDYKALEELQCVDEGCRIFNQEQMKWVKNADLYMTDTKAKIRLRKTDFSPAEETSMKGYKWEVTKEDPLSVTYGFKIAEPKKQRARPVWACGVNSLLGDGAFDSFRSSTREEVYEMMCKNNWFIEFDVMSMYDHFVLDKSVRNFFQFLEKEGNQGRLRLLPMGFGPSAAVAQSATYRLLNFSKKSTIASCIDNMGLANNCKETLMKEAMILVDRAAQVGFTLNNLPKPNEWRGLSGKQKEQIVAKLLAYEFDFLGVNYNLKTKTRRNTLKTIEKINTLVVILKKRGKITRRGVASVIGVFRYASEVIDYDLTDRFKELRQLANIIRECTPNVKEWDNLCPNVDYESLISWGEELLPNNPVLIQKAKLEGEKTVIITDASAVGWGAIAIDDHNLIEKSGKWTNKLIHSTEAEPKAIEMALISLRYLCNRRIIVLTDHINLVHAMRSSAPKGYFYNRLKSFVRKTFPDTELEVRFVPGLENPADGISRQEKFSKEDIERSRKLYREAMLDAGTGSYATQFPDGKLQNRPSWMR